MKKLILLTSLFLLPSITPVQAQDADVASQIEQLQNEIVERQSKIAELRQLLNTEDTVEFEHEGLSFAIQIEVTPVENQNDYLKDTYVKLHTTVENTNGEAVLFDPEWFTLYLADVAQTNILGPADQLEKQAIPEKTTVEGVIYYNVTKAVSNAKDLLVRYQPNGDYSIDETVFEFKINEYKRINRDEEVVQETTPEQPIQTAQEDKPTTEIETPAPDELSQEEIYKAIEDAYYNDLQNEYYNTPETFYYEEVYDYGEGIPYVDPWMNQVEIDIAEQEWIDDFSGN